MCKSFFTFFFINSYLMTKSTQNTAYFSKYTDKKSKLKTKKKSKQCTSSIWRIFIHASNLQDNNVKKIHDLNWLQTRKVHYHIEVFFFSIPMCLTSPWKRYKSFQMQPRRSKVYISLLYYCLDLNGFGFTSDI